MAKKQRNVAKRKKDKISKDEAKTQEQKTEPEESDNHDDNHSEKLFRVLSTPTLAFVLSVTVVMLSVLGTVVDVPESYFSNKYNILNQWFVKWSMGWTLAILTPYLLVAARVRKPEHRIPATMIGLLHLAVLTALWYFWVNVVIYTVHEWTAACIKGDQNATTDSRTACKRDGGSWIGYDISGHIFLLVLIILATNEEVMPMWRIGFPNRDKPWARVLWFLSIVVFLMQILSFVMVVMTSLYFHTLSEKIAGTSIALLSWMGYRRFLHTP